MKCRSPVLLALAILQPSVSYIPRKKGARYFSQELLLPPLDPVDGHDNPISSGSLPLLYTNDPAKVSRWIANHVPSKGCILGFDVESVPSTPWMLKQTSFRGAATVQLSTLHSSLVVQLATNSGKPSRSCGSILDAVLRDEGIIKAGCGVDDDMLDLRSKFRTLEARSRLELGRICNLEGSHVTPGLKSLSRNIAGVSLKKSTRLARSNWSEVPLSSAQLAYCGRDAWAGAAIAAVLQDQFPTLFSPESLADHLRNQRTLRDLQGRLDRRKQAKVLIKTALSPYHGSLKRPPPWKVDLVHHLRDVVVENQVERFGHFLVDVEALQLSAPLNATAGF